MRILRMLTKPLAALALLAGLGMAAVLTVPVVAGASGASFPVMCNLSATVNFSPPLTQGGVQNGNSAAVETTTITGGTLSHCLSSDSLGAPTGGTFPTVTITTPATKLIGVKVNKVQQYATGYCPSFSSPTTVKSLKGMVMNVTWTGGAGGTSTFTVKSPALGLNSSGEAGFILSGKQGPGSYSQKALNQVTAFLDTPDSIVIANGCPGGASVSSASIDGTTSTAIL